MVKYIKSHSNFVVKSKHQNVNGGTIWERDITTIGGNEHFVKGQIPIYRSSNFVITIRNDENSAHDVQRKKWENSPSGNDYWTLDDTNTNDIAHNDLIIRPKKDYYDLRDFAYFGSCTELIRGSINGIIQDFPGELYCESTSDGKGIAIGYYANEGSSNEFLTGFISPNGEPLYYISNPFMIDLHTNDFKLLEGMNPLRFFANNGYEYYDFINANGVNEGTVKYTPPTTYSGKHCPGDMITSFGINGATVYAYNGNGNMIYYLVDNSGFARLKNCHIRPKQEVFAAFYNNLSTFQKLLLNVDSNPLYKVTFRIIKENDYGYYTNMESFVFPKAPGNYNISTTESTYGSYIAKLTKIGTYYDEYFSDNIWRSMTHEAIKNFDWSYKREYTDGDDEEFIAGGSKIQKILRLYGREFDECKTFIDTLANTVVLSYDDRNNLPDYFLSDLVENDGWVVTPVYPYNTGEIPYSLCYEGEVTPYYINPSKNIAKFPKDSLKPFNSFSALTKYDKACDVFHNLIYPYFSNRKYTYRQVNNEFLRRLKLNSKAILRHKGTIEGIEMVLALFGLKSQRWCERNGKGLTGDYTITEYVANIDKGIDDPWDELHDMYHFDWINSTKTIEYKYSKQGITYLPYQGLPLTFVAKEDEKKRILYPYYSSKDQLDGDLYYQMNGGWRSAKKNGEYFQFNSLDEYITGETAIYKDTIRNVRAVKNFKELFQIRPEYLHDGIICCVMDASGKFAIIDGIVYDIDYDSTSIVNENCAGFVTLTVFNEEVAIGNQVFTDMVSTYDDNGEVVTHTINNLSDGYEIKAYIWTNKDDKQFVCEQSPDYGIMSFGLYQEELTHDMKYFCLDQADYKDRYKVVETDFGWRKLSEEDKEYKELSIPQNYFKGNNPHTGNHNYDDGYAYMHYFEKLFNYALKNDLFDARCFGENYFNVLEEAVGFGFTGLTDEETKTVIKTKDGKISKGCIMTKDKSGTSKMDYNTAKQKIEESYKVVNTKHLNISFNTKEALDVIKYFDATIMAYVEAMIPSSTILEIEYNTGGKSRMLYSSATPKIKSIKPETLNEATTDSVLPIMNYAAPIPEGGIVQSDSITPNKEELVEYKLIIKDATSVPSVKMNGLPVMPFKKDDNTYIAVHSFSKSETENGINVSISDGLPLPITDHDIQVTPEVWNLNDSQDFTCEVSCTTTTRNLKHWSKTDFVMKKKTATVKTVNDDPVTEKSQYLCSYPENVISVENGSQFHTNNPYISDEIAFIHALEPSKSVKVAIVPADDFGELRERFSLQKWHWSGGRKYLANTDKVNVVDIVSDVLKAQAQVKHKVVREYKNGKPTETIENDSIVMDNINYRFIPQELDFSGNYMSHTVRVIASIDKDKYNDVDITNYHDGEITIFIDRAFDGTH